MRFPSTLITWCSGSTRAPNRRTVCPSTSTRPAPISSSQWRRLPTPAAASTFCSRTPPGTSVRSSRSPPRSPQSSSSSLSCCAPPAGRPRPTSRLCPRVLIVLDVLDVLRQERRQVGQLVQARHAQPLKEVAGGAVQDRTGFRVGSRVLRQAAQHQRPDHAVAVHPPHRGYPRAADGLPVGDHGEGLERGLGKPYFLSVPDEPLHQRRAVLP